MSIGSRYTRSKAGAVAVVLFVFAALEVAAWLLSLSSIPGWQHRHLGGWNYLYHLLFFFPLILVLLDRRKAETYGLRMVNWRSDLRTGILLGLSLVAIPVAVDLVGGNCVLQPSASKHLASTLVFQVIFAAFAEELLFRGYMQGTLNEAFGRPWRLGATSFGIGLPVVCLIFGAAHLLNNFNPFQAQYTLNWSWFAASTWTGAAVAFLRERTGGILVPAAVHFGLNIYPTLLQGNPAAPIRSLSYSLFLFLCIWLLVAGTKDKQPVRSNQ